MSDNVESRRIVGHLKCNADFSWSISDHETGELHLLGPGTEIICGNLFGKEIYATLSEHGTWLAGQELPWPPLHLDLAAVWEHNIKA